jgi:hypothetical protein
MHVNPSYLAPGISPKVTSGAESREGKVNKWATWQRFAGLESHAGSVGGILDSHQPPNVQIPQPTNPCKTQN